MDSPVTQLLDRIRCGDETALNHLVATLYSELHRLASRHIRMERANHTLQTTALVHEAYLKLFNNRQPEVNDRVHFLAIASRVMRQVLVDHARAHSAEKRGGRISLVDNLPLEELGNGGKLELLELNGALEALALEDKDLAELVEMRYFGGMTAEESAAALGRSVHTVRHNLRFALAWLRRELSR